MKFMKTSIVFMTFTSFMTFMFSWHVRCCIR